MLVVVEFTSARYKLSPIARQARSVAAMDERARAHASEEDEDWTPSAGDVAQTAASAASPLVSDMDFEASLAEFQELARSAGAQIAAVLVQRRAKPDAATLVGGGKLDEIVATVASTGASLVLFDHDLTPSQARNVEARLPVTVIDRTQLILDIFARHARTREGMLQVELAQLDYSLPRLGGKGKTMSQTGGGIGTRGPGETQLEVDKRKINVRIDRIKQQLEAVRRIRRQQRGRREAVPVPTVALVGYTNAGKSTLFNSLTGAEVLASERMFATLDPKLRQLTLPSRRRILVSDTVGFIRNLPHGLVTSFRATLEEVERAELLLHVRDAASPTLEEQRVQVEAVLEELGVSRKPVLQVLNKIDLLPPDEIFPPDAIPVSGMTGQGLDALLKAIDAALTRDPLMEAEFRIPQSEGRVIASLERGATMLQQRYEGNLVYLKAVGPTSLLERYRRYQWKGAESAHATESDGSAGEI
ncbi:GTP-binding protein HflX [Bryocella elongata]|uniref:GTPase HflX n=2 Tax=Bryocella elongata TaxID=863522 RepID=A0A1H5ZFZ5_9BACT|nr:GTP-binding protein HflX [Bryocella elongata]